MSDLILPQNITTEQIETYEVRLMLMVDSSKEWSDIPVSAKLNDVTLEQAIEWATTLYANLPQCYEVRLNIYCEHCPNGYMGNGHLIPGINRRLTSPNKADFRRAFDEAFIDGGSNEDCKP